MFTSTHTYTYTNIFSMQSTEIHAMTIDSRVSKLCTIYLLLPFYSLSLSISPPPLYSLSLSLSLLYIHVNEVEHYGFWRQNNACVLPSHPSIHQLAGRTLGMSHEPCLHTLRSPAKIISNAQVMLCNPSSPKWRGHLYKKERSAGVAYTLVCTCFQWISAIDTCRWHWNFTENATPKVGIHCMLTRYRYCVEMKCMMQGWFL